MTNTKHTPGPWEYANGIIQECQQNGNIAKVKRTLASINTFGISGEEVEANAKLIAAAPELLDALINFHEMYEKLTENMISRIGWDINAKAVRAIKKATL